VYETPPAGYQQQDNFLNAVVMLATYLAPDDLLTACQNIERRLGRARRFRWGPRTIDIDILFWSDKMLSTERLQIPHPRASERAFVMLPLNEIASDYEIPVCCQQVAAVAKKFSEHRFEIVFPKERILRIV
jgi:2-amino-4-hydroxy-6-hydroxymethyldihydropteridine diphosphokinase